MAAQVVEVRFDAEVHDLTQKQVMGLLKEFDADHEIIVGLVYGGGAGAVVLDVPESKAAGLAEDVSTKAQDLGLTVTVIEVLDTDEYEERALAETVE